MPFIFSPWFSSFFLFYFNINSRILITQSVNSRTKSTDHCSLCALQCVLNFLNKTKKRTSLHSTTMSGYKLLLCAQNTGMILCNLLSKYLDKLSTNISFRARALVLEIAEGRILSVRNVPSNRSFEKLVKNRPNEQRSLLFEALCHCVREKE